MAQGKLKKDLWQLKEKTERPLKRVIVKGAKDRKPYTPPKKKR